MSEPEKDFDKLARSINGSGIIIPRFVKVPPTPFACDDLKKKIDHLEMMLRVGEYHPRPNSLFWKFYMAHRNFGLSMEKNWHSFWYTYRGCEEIGKLNKDLEKRDE